MSALHGPSDFSSTCPRVSITADHQRTLIMASESTPILELLAKKGFDLAQRLEQRTASASRLQADFLKNHGDQFEIILPDMMDTILELAAKFVGKNQKPLPEVESQQVVVRIRPDYEVAIRDGGGSLEIRSLPSCSGTLDSKVELARVLTNMLAYGQDPESFKANRADVPGAARRVRQIGFIGLREGDGEMPQLIDAMYEANAWEAGTEYKLVDDSNYHQALVGSDLGSIVPAFLLANTAAITIPRIGDIMVKKEIDPTPPNVKLTSDAVKNFKKCLAPFHHMVSEMVEDDSVTTKEFEYITKTWEVMSGMCLRIAKEMESLLKETEREYPRELVYSILFRLG